MEPEGSPWEDSPHVSGHNATSKTALEYLGLVTDYLSFPIFLVSILADILLIVVILKYKRLKIRTNYYLINFATFHICYILSTPCFYIILEMFYEGQLNVHWYCVWIRLENFAIALTLTFAAGYGVDSFFEEVPQSWFRKYKKRYPYMFSFFYFAHFLIYIVSATLCLKKGFRNNFNFYFLTFYYVGIILFLLYVFYKEKKLENDLKLSTTNNAKRALMVSFVAVLCWLPLFIIYNLMNVFKDIHSVETVLWYIAFLPEYVAYSSSILVVVRLWRSNKYFKVAFRKFFRRSVSNSDYNELNVDENETAFVPK